MIKKYRYFLIAMLLVLATPITTHKLNNYVTVLNVEQNEYVNFVEKFLHQIHEVQSENPINKGSFKSQGEIYTYNALKERGKVLNEYTYTADMVPSEFVAFHHRVVEFLTIYREGITIAQEGVLLMRSDIIEKGVSMIIEANELLAKLQEDFVLIQSPPKG